ncbi:MAG: NAD(P)H-dependent oxidoreductase [Silvanigrellaceae bacterium]
MSAERKIVVLFFHPNLKTSKVGSALSETAASIPGVLFRDMYGIYPDYLIDVKKEQQIAEAHDLIVFQHPVYWYSCPPLMKLWIDEVLEYGWAYGTGGTKLNGKKMLNVVSAGGSNEAYSSSGSNRFEIATFFSPFDQTAHLCGMKFFKPHVVYGARGLSEDQIENECHSYERLLQNYLRTGELG